MFASQNAAAVGVSPFGKNLDEDAMWEANYDVTAQLLYVTKVQCGTVCQ
jgi:hypothetical protein